MRKLVFRLYRLVVKLATFLHLPSGGLGKELYDCVKPNPSGWDWFDLIADTIGIVVGILPFVVF